MSRERTVSLTDEQAALLEDGLRLLLVQTHEAAESLQGTPALVLGPYAERRLEQIDRLAGLLQSAKRIPIVYDADRLARLRSVTAKAADATDGPDEDEDEPDGDPPTLLDPPADDEIPGVPDEPDDEAGIDNLGGVE